MSTHERPRRRAAGGATASLASCSLDSSTVASRPFSIEYGGPLPDWDPALEPPGRTTPNGSKAVAAASAADPLPSSLSLLSGKWESTSCGMPTPVPQAQQVLLPSSQEVEHRQSWPSHHIPA